jgi:hypothetical protein
MVGAFFRPGWGSLGRCRNLARPCPTGCCASLARTLHLPARCDRLAGTLPGPWPRAYHLWGALVAATELPPAAARRDACGARSLA